MNQLSVLSVTRKPSFKLHLVFLSSTLWFLSFLCTPYSIRQYQTILISYGFILISMFLLPHTTPRRLRIYTFDPLRVTLAKRFDQYLSIFWPCRKYKYVLNILTNQANIWQNFRFFRVFIFTLGKNFSLHQMFREIF